MDEVILEDLKKMIPKILEENPNLFSSDIPPDNWYDSRKFFLQKNYLFLEKVKEQLTKKYSVEISLKELFYMQKLFLVYPNYIPKKLLKLPWNQIKILLDLCNQEKRKFYIDLCFERKLNERKLKKYIGNDLYEKTLQLIEEINDYNQVTSKDFLQQVLSIYPMIWN